MRSRRSSLSNRKSGGLRIRGELWSWKTCRQKAWRCHSLDVQRRDVQSPVAGQRQPTKAGPSESVTPERGLHVPAREHQPASRHRSPQAILCSLRRWARRIKASYQTRATSQIETFFNGSTSCTRLPYIWTLSHANVTGLLVQELVLP